MRIGGTERQLTAIINRLNPSYFEAVICCLSNTNTSKMELPKCRKIVLNVDSFKSLHAVQKLFWLARYIKRENIQIVQTYFIDATIMGIVAAWLTGLKIRISCRRDLGFWHNWSIILRMKIINKITTHFMVNSYSVKDVLNKKEGVDKSKIDVIFNGVDLNDSNCIDSEKILALKRDLFGNTKTPVVGIVSNLNREVKRVDVFIKAAAIVKGYLPSCNFVVVGDGCLMPELVRLAEKSGLANNVYFVGSKDDVSTYIRIMDVVVNSSDSEGFSNSVLEAMAAQKAIVATDVGGNRENIENGVDGILVPPGDYKAMGLRIYEILSQPKYKCELGLLAYKKVKEKYSWDTIIKQIELYYFTLLGCEYKECYSTRE